MRLLTCILKLLLVCVCGSGLYGQKIVPMHDSLPVPPANKNRLFYLQRTIDRNTVIYEINYDKNGSLNEKKPVKIYWIDFEEGGKISPLTLAQNKFAYGVEAELIDPQKKTFLLRLEAYKKIHLYLLRDKNKRYEVQATIGGKSAVLGRILVNITGGTYLRPVVSFIELSGTQLHTGHAVSERIRPEQD